MVVSILVQFALVAVMVPHHFAFVVTVLRVLFLCAKELNIAKGLVSCYFLRSFTVGLPFDIDQDTHSSQHRTQVYTLKERHHGNDTTTCRRYWCYSLPSCRSLFRGLWLWPGTSWSSGMSHFQPTTMCTMLLPS